MLTPEDIRLVRFPTTRMFEKGYREQDVDRFLRLIEDEMRDLQSRLRDSPDASVTEKASEPNEVSTRVRTLLPEEVHNVAFSKPPFGMRGYNEDEVDGFLDEVEATITELRNRLSKYEAI